MINEKDSKEIHEELVAYIGQVHSKVTCKTARLLDEYVVWGIEQQHKPLHERARKEAYKIWHTKIMQAIDKDLNRIKILHSSQASIHQKRNFLRQNMINEHATIKTNLYQLGDKASPLTRRRAEELMNYQKQEMSKILNGNMSPTEYQQHRIKLQHLVDELQTAIKADNRRTTSWLDMVRSKIQKWLVHKYVALQKRRFELKKNN